MAEDVAVDLCAEMGPAGADCGLSAKGADEGRQFGKRRCKVGVPEPDDLRLRVVQKPVDAGSDGFGLTDVLGQVKGVDRRGLAFEQGEDFRRVVG